VDVEPVVVSQTDFHRLVKLVAAQPSLIGDDFNDVSGSPSGTKITIPISSLPTTVADYYGVWGVDEYHSSMRLVSRAGRDSAIVLLLAVNQIYDRKGITPIEGNLWSLAREGWWTSAERNCVANLAERRSGNVNKIYPFQSFQQCLATDDFSPQQCALLTALIAQPGFSQSVVASVRYLDPIAGRSGYRGWYYCYEAPGVCEGQDRIFWVQGPSAFNARDGRMKGVDLHDLPGDSEQVPIIAAADGILTFADGDTQGWGNALLLPFVQNGSTFIAVYANLPATAKELDGRKVRAGDSLGSSGCSENSGDGIGHCNSFCVVNGFARSDAHLHFEMIKVDGVSFSKVAPTEVIGFQPERAQDQHFYSFETAPTAITSSLTRRLLKKHAQAGKGK
jgi:Peptidase family M23